MAHTSFGINLVSAAVFNDALMQLVIRVFSKDNLVKYLNNCCTQTHRRKRRFLNVIDAAVFCLHLCPFLSVPTEGWRLGRWMSWVSLSGRRSPSQMWRNPKAWDPHSAFPLSTPSTWLCSLSHYFPSSHSVILELTSPRSEKHQLRAREYKPHQVAASILHAAQSLLKYLRILPFASSLHFRLNNRQNFYLPHV